MNKIVNYADVPLDLSIHEKIRREFALDTSLVRSSSAIFSNKFPNLIKIKLKNVDIRKIATEIQELYEEHGFCGMAHLLSDIDSENKFKRSTFYGGLGLTYNINYHYDVSPMHQVWGYPRIGIKNMFSGPRSEELYNSILGSGQQNKFFQFAYEKGNLFALNWFLNESIISKDLFDSTLKFLSLSEPTGPYRRRDTYTDSYGFTSLSLAAEKENIGGFLGELKRKLIRSRIASVRTKGITALDNSRYHRDESYFLELRLVICVDSPPGFGIDLEGVGHYEFEPGCLYVWDTLTKHGVYAPVNTDLERNNLVIGISPWINENHGAWTANEYFNEKHPLQMVLDGDIIPNSMIDEVYIKE